MINIKVYKTVLNKTGLCNQLFFLFSAIIDCIKNGESELNLNYNFLLDINTNNYCKINEIVDIYYLNSILNKYNLKIIEENNNTDILKIISVEYGDFDITEHFSQKFLKNNSISIKAKTNLNSIFGDPKPFVLKQIKIKYSLNDEIKEIIENERNGLLINNINIISNSNIKYIYPNWRLLFSDYDNLEFQNFIIKNFKFSDTIIDKALIFLQNNNINIREKLNCFHLRIEDDCIHHWSKLSNLDFNDYKFKLESKFINLIEAYFEKNIPILLLSYDTNNTVIEYLKNNNYVYFIKEDKEPNKREYNAAIDLQIGLFCNNIFIGCESSTFSQIIHKKIENKTSIFINLENVDSEVIVIKREY